MPIIRDGGNASRRPRRSAATPHPARRSWFELVLFFFAAAGMYLIAALFDSAWTGASGRQIGAYLRAAWGGALLVPLLFWLYLCFAWFIRLRIPRPLGQILGTCQLHCFHAGLVSEGRMEFELDPGRTGACGGRPGAFLRPESGGLGDGLGVLRLPLPGRSVLRLAFPLSFIAVARSPSVG